METRSFTLDENTRAAIRSGVSCALLLERDGFALDRRDSTRKCLKFRNGGGQIVIVNHEGRGWWDTGSTAKGDVFALARHLHPEKRFIDVCTELGSLVGVAPQVTEYVRERHASPAVEAQPAERWQAKRPLRRGSPMWSYLTEQRCLPNWIVRRAASLGCIRDGYRAAWFAHRDETGAVCGAELRGPETHLALTGSVKTLFRFQPHAAPAIHRLVVCEAAIDALSFAALDDEAGSGTLYTSTAGGLGPDTLAALRRHLEAMAALPDAVLVVATDDDEAGDRYAEALCDLAVDAGVAVVRRFPPDGAKDFNQTLKNRAAGAAAGTVHAD